MAELNSAGQVTATNLFGANGLISRTNPTGPAAYSSLFYAFDERGNVSHRVSSTGSVLSNDVYDAYGFRQPQLQPGGGTYGYVDVWGFGGQAGYYTDSGTGLLLLTNRFYDPQGGRFLNRDPAGYGGGINLYSVQI